MGQRHQIYVKMPANLGIAGFHHQWLYGMTAVESLSRLLKFYLNQSEYGPLNCNTAYGLKRQSECIRAIYSVDVDSGYWHYVHNLRDDKQRNEDQVDPVEIQDPRNGDNNDGITIIDVSQGDFRYCFMSISHLEGETNPKKTCVPMNARDYLLCYYPKFFDKLGNVDWRLKEETGEERRAKIDDDTFDRVLHSLLRIEKNSKLLTLAECKKLFPKMYKKEKRK